MPVQSLNENIAQSVKKKKRQPVYTKELTQLKIIETIKDWVDEITEGIESLSTTKSKKVKEIQYLNRIIMTIDLWNH